MRARRPMSRSNWARAATAFLGFTMLLSAWVPFDRQLATGQNPPSEPQSGMGGGGRPKVSAAAAVQAPAVPSSTHLPELVDITSSTGINFEHLSSPDQRYIVESMSGGVAIIDYDRDGWPDIFFTNAQSVEMALSGKKARSALYHNNRDGTFTDVTDKAGVGYPCWANGVVVGDYNNDGWPDLLVTCFGGVVLYRNNGDGTFTDVTKSSGLSSDTGWATGAAFGDYDNDGWQDLFVAHYVDFSLNDLPLFGSRKTDVSKEAGVDDPQRLFGLTAIWSDFDNDGHLDLFVANDGEPNYLYHNDGNGHFSDVALLAGVSVSQSGFELANMGVAFGDYLHSGRFSLAISHFSDEYATLFRNDGAMSFTDDSDASGISRGTNPYVGWGIGFFDFDNDGWLDLFVADGHVYPQVDSADLGTKYREPKLLFLNQHNGIFADISRLVGPAIQIPQVSRGVAMGDLFNDGTIDIVVENLQGKPMILRPKGVTNHWISFELEGTRSNRLALNARVRVTAYGFVQSAEVQSGGSYLSQNDLRLHFGLGNADHVDKAEILWPSGKTEILTNLPASHFYYVQEGHGLVPGELSRPQLAKHP